MARHGLSGLPRDIHWLPCAALHAEACGILGDPAWAAPVYRELKPYGERMVVFGYGAGSWGSVSRSLGLLATAMSRWDEAEEHFRMALDRELRCGARPWVAWTLLAYARMLVRQGRVSDRDRAVSLAGGAKEIGSALGMAKLSGAASELMAQA
jgi:hypothetical protein